METEKKQSEKIICRCVLAGVFMGGKRCWLWFLKYFKPMKI